ncbi:MAG: hypothetical protein ACREQE_05465 [Candidatus Binataceae bacterium]
MQRFPGNSRITTDLIIALDHGKVAETGTHTELLHRGGTYARLYAEQTRGLSLAPAAERNATA